MTDEVRDRRVLHVAAEMSPYASAGGLGEVVGSLPAALQSCGWAPTVLLPRYRGLRDRLPASKRVWSGTVQVEQPFFVEVWEVGSRTAPRLWLLDCPQLFDRDGIYGDAEGLFPDNDLRFGVLSRTAAHLLDAFSDDFDVLHAHDWHAAPAVAFARTQRPQTATVLTIHNFAYRGDFSVARLRELGLTCVDPAFASFLACGILAADAVTTVSPQYAQEIAADPAFVRRGDPPRGIVNGLDVKQWDPSRDDRLAANFDADHLARRTPNRDALRAELGLDPSAGILAAFLGRFAFQKGLDVLLDAAPRLLDRGVQLIVHGNGDRELERRVVGLAAEHPGRFAARIGFDRDFAVRLLAGIDLLIMPSRFEPCGLSQLQAMRYGAIVVAHATGGLKDTIHPFGERGARSAKANGFSMKTLTPRALSLAVGKALRYRSQPRAWRTLQRNAMREDVSWTASAGQYARLYDEMLPRAEQRAAAPPALADPEAAAADEPVAGFALEGPPLDDHYGEPVVHLTAQAPRMLYAYWEVPDAAGLRLCVHEEGRRRVVAAVQGRGEAWIPARPERSYAVALEDEAGRRHVSSPSVTSPVEPFPPPPGESEVVEVADPPTPAPIAREGEEPAPAPRWTALGYPSEEPGP
jgi:starch synthase